MSGAKHTRIRDKTMTPTQYRILKLLKVKIPEGMSAGEAHKKIVSVIKSNGVPSGLVKKLLQKNGYITEIDIGFSVQDVLRKQQKILDSYLEKGPRLISFKAAMPKQDTLGVLLSDELYIRQLYKNLKRFGMVTTRWHKNEGRISVQGHYFRSPDETPERDALRKYMMGLKKKYGPGSDKYFRTIRKLAKRAGIRWKKVDRAGNPLTPIAINLMLANALAAALKRGNKVLKRAVGLKGG